MRRRGLLLCEDDSWERDEHPRIIESCWKDMFQEDINVHGCSDIVDDERPAGPRFALARVGQYDGLLLDVWWGRPGPGGSPHGIDIARAVRQRYPELPIIVISRHVRLEDFQSLIPLGIAAYLTKGDATARTWCAEINQALDRAIRERAGQPLYLFLRRVLADTPEAWCRNEVGEAASEVWRHESPYRKWETFWQAWGKHLGDKRINIPCDQMAKFFAKEELLTLAVGEALRGHLEHVLYVYFTGYVISHLLPEFRRYVMGAVRNLLREKYDDAHEETYWDSFQVSWLVAATLHDAAYPLEILPDVARESSRIQGLFPFALMNGTTPPILPQDYAWENDDGAAAQEAFRTTLRRVYDENSAAFVENNVTYSKGGTPRFNHGIASGAFLMSKAREWTGVHGCLPLEFFQWTATAMALHALKHAAAPGGISLSLQRDPLAFLLALCDELQVWNRSRPDETPTSSDFRRVELAAMDLSDQKLTASVEYDFFPLIDASRRAESINALRGRLNQDQRLLQVYLKPAPLSVEVQSRIRDSQEELPPITLS